MKRFYIIIFLTALFATTTGNMTAAERELDSMWDRANTMYINADYTGAIAVYDSILNSGYSSTKLYYNLGNAYFKAGQNGKAIVYYNKALALSPTDADTKYNLAVANSFVKDEIAEIPTFFLVKWLRSVRDLLGSNAWAIISLIALGCALCGLSSAIMWPGSYSLASASIKGGGTMMFAFLAIAGDLGGTIGPAIIGTVSSLCEDNLKTGFGVALIFPIGIFVLLVCRSVRKNRNK